MSAAAGITDHAQGAGPRYTMHPLVREIAAELLLQRDREERQRTYRAFVDFMLGQGEVLHSCRMEEDGDAFIQLLSNEQLNLAEVARVLVELSNEVAVQPQTLHSCELLADTLFTCGMWQQAVPLLHIVVRLQEKALGPHCLLSSRASLAFQLMRAGKNQEAEALRQKVMALTKQACGAHGAQTLRAQLNLAEIQVCRSELQKAEENCREVLNACHGTLLPGIVLSAKILLSVCLCRRGQPTEAMTIMSPFSLSDLAGVDDQDYQVVFASRAHLVRALHARGELQAAESMQRELLGTMESAFGVQAGARLDVNIAKVRLAALLADAGKLEGSAQVLRQALMKRELLLGQMVPGHIEDAHVRASLGAVLARCRDVELAEIMLRWAVGPYVEELGPTHPQSLKVRKIFATILQMCGKMEAEG